MKLTPDNCDVFVYTYREGMMSPVGHDLKLRVTSFEISFDEDEGRVEASFDADSLEVHASVSGGDEDRSKPSKRDRKKIEKNIRKDVLEASRHPKIEFQGDATERDGGGWDVDGELQLHGHRNELTATVEERDGGWYTKVSVHQPDYGIEQFTAFFGALKVKPDVEIEVIAAAG